MLGDGYAASEVPGVPSFGTGRKGHRGSLEYDVLKTLLRWSFPRTEHVAETVRCTAML